MDLGLVGKIVGGATGLLQSGLGIADRIKGKKEYKAAQDFFEKNKYDVPEGAKASLQTAERMASGARLPAEDLRRAQIGEATAAGLGASQQAATSASDVQSMIAQLYGGQQRAEQSMGIEAAQRYDENQRQLQRAQEMFGGYEDIQWQQNVLAPYQQRLARAEQYSQRGAEGISAGLSGIAGAASGAVEAAGAQGRLSSLMDYTQGAGGETTPLMQNRAFLAGQQGVVSNPFESSYYRTPILG